ncbi:inositol monophosphatase [Altererythrobacter sp. KTW20L]|uniref:inositol monophosphatase family protein n=1 Tax=Altererythrobacter sp. KTW20L TaxID=2942210 RepID=UPI0020C06075|nr:inositol monophosphatase family protein [Altererythrobacter sp. KTW20L]MCL6251368.1 inositol monophosphatase [Altererythrobacter sp. KTW20L]
MLDRELLALMRSVSEAAILPRYRNLQHGEVEDKGGNDPVTVADREAELLLAEGLARIDGSLAIVGEEATHADAAVMERLSQPCWIIDPLDGTRNFAKGQPPFGVLIARAEHGLAQSGWIYDCLTERFCAAHHGQGAYIDGQRFTARPTGEASPVAAISLLFMDLAKRDRVMEHIAPHYRLVDVPYCAAEQYPRLALGTNDVSLFERTLPWDHAAGALWLNEAGGVAARPDGSPYRVDGDVFGGLIGAASPALWDELAERMRNLA